MDYWKALVDEVMQPKTTDSEFRFTSIGHDLLQQKKRQARRMRSKSNPRTAFYLQGEFQGIYLTKREGECVYHFAQGKTIPEAAEVMGLSPRTVEFYVKNMKLKIGVSTKAELMEALMTTNIYELLSQCFKRKA